MGFGKVIQVALRGFEFLWALLVLAISGAMVAQAFAGNPSIVNYSVFVGAFGMLSLFYLIPASLKESLQISPWFPLIVDALNTLFWFCGAVALAAKLGVHSCSNQEYLRNNGITNGSRNDKSARCTEAQATCAFLFFGFFSFLVSTVFSGLNARSGGSVRPGIRRGPSVSRV